MKTILTITLAALLVGCGEEQVKKISAPVTNSASVGKYNTLSSNEVFIVLECVKIWRRQKDEAWAYAHDPRHDLECNCGESHERARARSRWSDIYMADNYFERMEQELK